MARTAPPSAVLAAFGAHGTAILLPGGQGETWQAGDIVLKPSGLTAETRWVAETLSMITQTARIRVATPVRAASEGWTVQGWQAWQWMPGEPDPRRWDEVLAAGQAFHAALTGLPRPSFLDERDDPWTYAERVAWEELPLRGDEVMNELLAPLARARRPVGLPAQPVHGDLLGNVMFAEGLPPAVIDWPVYFRPVPWALAVAVVDALTWHGAPVALPERWADQAEWDQMLVRALMFRIATNEGHRRAGLPTSETATSYQPVVDLVLGRVGR